jgi:glycosyltransferase involved in cell wall biosynthesis
VLVGTDFAGTAPARPVADRPGPTCVLFYGQFIPLHGIETIVRAAQVLESRGTALRWLLVGRGQESPAIDRLVDTLGARSIERVPWVEPEAIPSLIDGADICLGIFGTSEKARRVIPNKVFQVLARQKPLVTADTPAIRELLATHPLVRLVPPGDPAALAAAVEELAATRLWEKRQPPLPVVDASVVGAQLRAVLDEVAMGTRRSRP